MGKVVTQIGNGAGTHAQVQEYYGKILSTKNDLQSNACCSTETTSPHIRKALGEVHHEVSERFYGCGSPIPEGLNGCVVLDLGCGTGRDCFVLSKLVGPEGRVIGVDMTEEQLATAKQYQQHHADLYGHSEPNTEFLHGYIEDLASLGIPDNSVDVVVSNCVINLSPNKERVFSEIFRVLKPGGELYFSDIFASSRVPSHFMEDQVLLGECLAGAMYIEDFRRLLTGLGYPEFRVVAQSVVTPSSQEVFDRIGMIDFSSVTVRVFNLDDIEDRCEDYGQVAYYKGSIPHFPHAFALDDHHLFRKGMPALICGNTASILSGTRFREHFTVQGDRNQHFGLFDCDTGESMVAFSENVSGGSCC